MSTKKRRFIQIVIALAFVALGALGLKALTESKPQLKRRQPTVPVPVVQVLKIETGSKRVTVRGEGTVQPLREIHLVPQVGGKLIHVSPSLVNGGEFKKGDILLRIDPVDYELAVTLAEAKVKDAESKLRIAEEDSAASVEEWRSLYKGGKDGKSTPPPLVAKRPQLAAARARLEADRADLKRAKLNLQRTRLSAPFDGRVSQESVDIGQYVTPGQSLATLFSTEAAEIVVPMEGDALQWIHVPGFTSGDQAGSPATVRARIAGQDLPFLGKVVRTEGKLDARTRMIHVVVRVERPYAERPPLAVGLFVSVEIHGQVLDEAAIIPRIALRSGTEVWVVNDGRLKFRKVTVARVQGDKAFIKSGLKDGDLLVTSPLKAVTDGMKVRTTLSGEGREAS